MSTVTALRYSDKTGDCGAQKFSGFHVLVKDLKTGYSLANVFVQGLLKWIKMFPSIHGHRHDVDYRPHQNRNHSNRNLSPGSDRIRSRCQVGANLFLVELKSRKIGLGRLSQTQSYPFFETPWSLQATINNIIKQTLKLPFVRVVSVVVGSVQWALLIFDLDLKSIADLNHSMEKRTQSLGQVRSGFGFWRNEFSLGSDKRSISTWSMDRVQNNKI